MSSDVIEIESSDDEQKEVTVDPLRNRPLSSTAAEARKVSSSSSSSSLPIPPAISFIIDSSPQQPRQGAERVTQAQNRAPLVVSLIESDEDYVINDSSTATREDGRIPVVFQEAKETSKKQSSRKRENQRVYESSKADDSDSEDSLSEFLSCGLSQKTSNKKPAAASSTVANIKPAAATRVPSLRKSGPSATCVDLTEIQTSASYKPIVQNPYARKKVAPATSIASSTPSNSTKPILRNPYASKKKVTPSTVLPEKTMTNFLFATSMQPIPSRPCTAKRKAPSTSLSASYNVPFYPSNLTPAAKTYPDIRAKMCVCLWKYARTLTRQSHNRQKLDQTIKKLNALALSEYPIRSVEEYVLRFLSNSGSVGTNRVKLDEMKDQLDKGGWETSRMSTPTNANSQGKYYTISEACLVACHVKVQQIHRSSKKAGTLEVGSLSQKEFFISETWLLPEIDRRLLPECPAQVTRPSDADSGVEFYSLGSTRSAEYKQIDKLTCEPQYLKARKFKGKRYLELLPRGLETAKKIQSRVYPAPPGPYRTSNKVDMTQYSNILLAMDLREGGGGTKTLHGMANKLDWQKIPYFVATLKIGDYAFFIKEKLLPVLIERKSVQDVAMSIYDGRWKRQKQRMYHGQYIFGYETSKLAFIIEGKQERHQVTGGYIGSAQFQVSLERLNAEIENLKKEGFHVLRTSDERHSMSELALWTKRIAAAVAKGKMEAKYTYHEFNCLVKKIPKETDLSRIAKDNFQRRSQDSDDSDFEVVINTSISPKRAKPSPKRLTYEEPKKKIMEYSKFNNKQLLEECIKRGLAKSGKRVKLIERLNLPPPPSLWLQRKAKGEYVPARHDTGGCALLVALLTLHQEFPEEVDFPKEQIYVRAEALQITKNPFSGGTTQTGPYHYDGWSNMKALCEGDPPLVAKKKNRFRLTKSCELSGFPLAEQMHVWCHAYNKCKCQEL